MPTHQARASQPSEVTDSPRIQPRTALTMTETGWCSAKARSQSGIEAVGTNALLAKVSGKSQMKPPDWAASGLRTSKAIAAPIHEKAKLTSNSNPPAASQPSA